MTCVRVIAEKASGDSVANVIDEIDNLFVEEE